MSIIAEPRKPVRLPLSRALKVSRTEYTERITFRVTREMKNRICEAAELKNMKPSEFTRCHITAAVEKIEKEYYNF